MWCTVMGSLRASNCPANIPHNGPSGMASSGISGPDFICIGMIKAGTEWLYDQLRHHPDFWMPPVKEIRYLGSKSPQMRPLTEHWQRVARARDRGRSGKSLRDERDYEFLKEGMALRGRGSDFQNYSRLFRFKGNLLSGDISPDYSTMGDTAVSQIAEKLPQAKIVLLVRDPVSRAWSGLSMLYRAGKFDPKVLENPDDFRAYYKSSVNAERRSYPSRILQRWRQYAPEMNFRHFFFDELSRDSEGTRAAILQYLGGNSEKTSGDLPAGYNRKAEKQKLVLTEPIKAVLVDHFKDELRACADLFGGPAKEWPARYGV